MGDAADTARHIPWPDEEPEATFISRDFWLYPGCGYCGSEHHRGPECPNKPIGT